MSEKPKSPITMVGAEDAAACVDGVCEWSPPAQVPSSEQNGVAPAEEAPSTPV
ncbi:MAG: hypothetical protein IT190_04275 [Microbacteriaceae bacterium]|nr:hypothetical protein [Microbacteriaceae bacterium]